MVRPHSSDTVGVKRGKVKRGKGVRRIIKNVLVIHTMQRVFKVQIDRSGVSKRLLQNRTAIIENF